jgi:hypothetical protein
MSVGTPYTNGAKNFWEFLGIFPDMALHLFELIF